LDGSDYPFQLYDDEQLQISTHIYSSFFITHISH